MTTDRMGPLGKDRDLITPGNVINAKEVTMKVAEDLFMQRGSSGMPPHRAKKAREPSNDVCT